MQTDTQIIVNYSKIIGVKNAGLFKGANSEALKYSSGTSVRN